MHATGLAPRTRASRQAGVSVLLGGAFVAAALCVSAVQLVSLRQDKAALERAKVQLEGSVKELDQRKDSLAKQNGDLEQSLAARRNEIQLLEQHKALLLQSMKELSPAPVVATRVPTKVLTQKLTPSSKPSGLAAGGGVDLGHALGGGGTTETPPSQALGAQAHGRVPAEPGAALVSASMTRASATERPDTAPSGKKLYEFAVWLDLPPALRARVRQVSYNFDHPTFLVKRHRSTDAASGFRTAYTGWGCLSTVLVEVEYRDGTPSDQFSFDQCAAIVTSSDGAKK
ncbi:MAG: pYEATS domain-containing protein [Polyangiales bacterium]